ncbi:MAG: hypothetical protein ACR2GY_14445 [Phycisphaerales bacterium]
MTRQTTPIQSLSNTSSRTGFTLVELLLVIGIIVLLIGILLPALAAVNKAAKRTETSSILNDFSKACDLFFQQHGFNPGIIPDEVLFSDAAANGGAPQISGTEAAILHLMGGYVREEDVGTARFNGSEFSGPDWQLISLTRPSGAFNVKVNVNEIGNGPTIDGKRYDAYFNPGKEELRVVRGQAGEGNVQLPDLVDSWGNPVIYIRRARSIGLLIGQQFFRSGADPYLQSTGLGEALVDQTDNGQVDYSILNVSGGSPTCNNTFTYEVWNFMMIIGHSSFAQGTCGNGNLVYTEPRGSYVLISAGSDGIYFSRTDGGGTSTNPVDEIQQAAVVEDFDDVVVVGGGT